MQLPSVGPTHCSVCMEVCPFLWTIGLSEEQEGGSYLCCAVLSCSVVSDSAMPWTDLVLYIEDHHLTMMIIVVIYHVSTRYEEAFNT